MTPIRINLLPHRQMRRAQAQRLFSAMAIVSGALAVAVVAAGQYWISNAQAQQERRNGFLREEIAKLDKQIAEIAQLKQKMQDLLDRKEVVESLQVNRAEAVHLFDELARRVPEGLYLKNVKQTGDGFVIIGLAQSSARVSTFMRELSASSLFLEPTLVEVRATQVGNQRLNEFTLNVQIERAEPAGKEEKASGQGAAG
ncbi:MAG: PilN domain-containing protein [Pseudomonadota bacterium]